jgi:hypothetical protein
MEILKTIKEAVAPSKAVAATEQTVEAAKSIEEITADSAAKYPPTTGDGNTPEPEIKKRKPRSDLGIQRGPRGMGKRSAKDAQLASIENGQAAGFSIDKEIVEKTASTVLNTIDSVVVRKIGSTTFQLSGNKELARELSQNAALAEGELKLMSELTGIIFEKHGLLTGYAPEILLTVVLAEWGVRVSLTMRKLNQLAEAVEKNKRNERQPE